MVKFRNPTGRFLTGAVAAAALTAFAAGAFAQMSPDTRQGMTDRERMMQQERMGGMGQQMTDRERALRQQRMQTPGSAQTSAMPGGAGAADSVQGRLQMWDMDRYVGLQQAVAAHQYCRSELSEPAMRAVIARIEARAGEPPSPGRKLAIQDDAQFHMKEIIRVEGCADPRVKSALSAFDELLAPAANEAVAAMPR